MKTRMGPMRKAAALALGLGVMVLQAGPAFAAQTSKGSGGLGLGAIIFLALFALIILAQLIPGLVLFGSLLVALFSKVRGKAGAAAEAAAGAGKAGEPR